MLGTSVAVTCHRICRTTAVRLPRRSLAASERSPFLLPPARAGSSSAGRFSVSAPGREAPSAAPPSVAWAPLATSCSPRHEAASHGQRGWWAGQAFLLPSPVPSVLRLDGSPQNQDVSDSRLPSVTGEELASGFWVSLPRDLPRLDGNEGWRRKSGKGRWQTPRVPSAAIGWPAFLQRKPREGRLWGEASSPPGSCSGHQVVTAADTGDFKMVTGEGSPTATDHGYKTRTCETLPRRPRRTVVSVYSSGPPRAP